MDACPGYLLFASVNAITKSLCRKVWTELIIPIQTSRYKIRSHLQSFLCYCFRYCAEILFPGFKNRGGDPLFSMLFGLWEYSFHRFSQCISIASNRKRRRAHGNPSFPLVIPFSLSISWQNALLTRRSFFCIDENAFLLAINVMWCDIVVVFSLFMAG